MNLTLDSSIIIAAARRQESYHQPCRRLLDRVRLGDHQAIEPLTVLVEIAGAIRRRTGSPALAQQIQASFQSFDTVRFVELDSRRMEEASQLARALGLRGMDAIVVQVAQEFGSTLVTLDNEMTQRAGSLVVVRSVTNF